VESKSHRALHRDLGMLPTPTDCSSNSMRTYTSTGIAVPPWCALGRVAPLDGALSPIRQRRRTPRRHRRQTVDEPVCGAAVRLGRPGRCLRRTRGTAMEAAGPLRRDERRGGCGRPGEAGENIHLRHCRGCRTQRRAVRSRARFVGRDCRAGQPADLLSRSPRQSAGWVRWSSVKGMSSSAVRRSVRLRAPR
jgi:hypothetical protein